MQRAIVIVILSLIVSFFVRFFMTSDIDYARRDLEMQNNVTVTVQNWSRGPQEVVTAALVVSNENDVAVRDVETTCYGRDAGGTNVGSGTYTLRDQIEPKARRALDEVSLGALDARTTQIVCWVTNLGG